MSSQICGGDDQFCERMNAIYSIQISPPHSSPSLLPSALPSNDGKHRGDRGCPRMICAVMTDHRV